MMTKKFGQFLIKNLSNLESFRKKKPFIHSVISREPVGEKLLMMSGRKVFKVKNLEQGILINYQVPYFNQCNFQTKIGYLYLRQF